MHSNLKCIVRAICTHVYFYLNDDIDTHNEQRAIFSNIRQKYVTCMNRALYV